MPDNILALDTACGRTAACLLAGDDCLLISDEDARPGSGDLALRLDALIRRAGLGWRDIEIFVFGRGPGSFTGLRIGAATIAGLNSDLKTPVLHLSSLAVTAAQADCDDTVAVLEDARAGEAFIGLYQAGEAQQADACLNWSQVQAMPPHIYLSYSDIPAELPGWRRLPFARNRSEALAACTRNMLRHGLPSSAPPRYPEPLYLQPSQAERNRHV